MGRNVYGLGKKAASRSWIFHLAIMLLIALAAMGYATQQIAELFNYHKDLGDPVTSISTGRGCSSAGCRGCRPANIWIKSFPMPSSFSPFL